MRLRVVMPRLLCLLFVLCVAPMVFGQLPGDGVYNTEPLPDCPNLIGPCSSDPIQGGPFDTSYDGKYYKVPPPPTYAFCQRVDGCWGCDSINRCRLIPFMSGGSCDCANVQDPAAGPNVTYCQKYGQCTFVG
jgi:hypothetical protein